MKLTISDRAKRRIFVFSLLVLCRCPVPVEAAEHCVVVDLMPEFWRVLSSDHSIEHLHSALIDAHPDIYNAHVVSLPIGIKWTSKWNSEEQYDRTHRAEIYSADDYLSANIPGYMREFQQTFADYRCNFTFYIAPSFGNMDGTAVSVNGIDSILLAPDVIPRFHKLHALKVLIDHETFHIYHHQATGEFGAFAEAIPTIGEALWSEGLATFVSWRMSPGIRLDIALLQPGIAERAAVHVPTIANELLAHLDERDESTFKRFFVSGNEPEGYPPRAGYYLGLLICEDLSNRYSLQKLAHLRGPVLHAWLVAELRRLSKPKTASQSKERR